MQNNAIELYKVIQDLLSGFALSTWLEDKHRKKRTR